jgi:hypothetical protein
VPLSIRFKACRQPRRLAFERLIALQTGHAGAAAAAGVWAFPRLIGMILTNPAGVIAAKAHLQERLSERKGSFDGASPKGTAIVAKIAKS